MNEQPKHPPHSRVPEHIWAAARRDYEAGASVRVVAERFGLNIRTVTRHAKAEKWNRPRISAADGYEFHRKQRQYDPYDREVYMACTIMRQLDEERLLLSPDSIGLCLYAFRRAAECANVGGPTEALSWIRLAEATARLRRGVNVDIHPYTEADYRRISAMSREEDMAAMQAMGSAPKEEGGY